MDSYREECDLLADKAITVAVMKLGKDILNSRNLFANIKQLSKDGVQECMSYLEVFEKEPPWTVDWEAIEAGRRFFVRNAIMGGLVLMYGSLVSSFAAAKGNKVLMATSRLTGYGDVRQRVFETLAFVKVVMLKDKEAIKKVCCRVRLLHAAVRYYITHSMDNWDYNECGHPVSQEDMAGTLSTFSSSVIHGLDWLGITGSKEECDGYQHLWKYVGYHLGICNTLLCDTYQDEWQLALLIKDRHFYPDEDSKTLTESLLQEFANKMPFHFSYSFSSDLSRYMIGNKLADELRLQKMTVLGSIGIRLLCWLNKSLAFIQYYFQPLERGMYRFGSYALDGL
ncbi:uncharacterized protein LOC116298298, partial [Actinia tenebrosa]|uniref:Uncharacterized protein LOC116298298 n=1 Tax=Actinia tenebrosa TaxID=6105 RepID=A0A6P8I3V5_ACTTE